MSIADCVESKTAGCGTARSLDFASSGCFNTVRRSIGDAFMAGLALAAAAFRLGGDEADACCDAASGERDRNRERDIFDDAWLVLASLVLEL